MAWRRDELTILEVGAELVRLSYAWIVKMIVVVVNVDGAGCGRGFYRTRNIVLGSAGYIAIPVERRESWLEYNFSQNKCY